MALGCHDGSVLRQRWCGAPRRVVVAVVAEATVLAYGTMVHLAQLWGAWPPYPWAPDWLAAYFISLTVLDPLAAYLLLDRRQAGLVLAAAVLVTDACANGYASYWLLEGTLAARIAQGVISGLAAGSLLLARQARPWMRPHRNPSQPLT
jgi:hypothetical protein